MLDSTIVTVVVAATATSHWSRREPISHWSRREPMSHVDPSSSSRRNWPFAPLDPRPITVATRIKLFASCMICRLEPCFSTCSSCSCCPMIVKPLSLHTPSSWSKTLTLCWGSAFVQRSATFHAVGSCCKKTSPDKTCCCIQSILPSRCRTFPTPCLDASCLAEELSVSR